jgi:hypothetical protein
MPDGVESFFASGPGGGLAFSPNQSSASAPDETSTLGLLAIGTTALHFRRKLTKHCYNCIATNVHSQL